MQVLTRLADALFGSAVPPEPPGRGWLVRYWALAAALALIIFVRRPDSILRPQFWAEDGNIFFYEQVTLGFWSALFKLYCGFPFLGHRLVAALAAVVPTVAVPLAYNVSTLVITALTVSTFSLPAFRHLVRSDGLRAAVCVATVCIPAGQELLATPSTLGNYSLAIWLVLLSVMQTPRTSVGVVVWCAAGALAVLSVPAAPVVAPLWMLRAVRGLSRRQRSDLAFAATQFAALLAVAGAVNLSGGSVDPSGQLPAFEFGPRQVWLAFRALGWVMAACVDAALVPMSVFRRLEMQGTLAVVAPAVIAAGAVALAFRGLSPRARLTVGLALYLFVSTLYLILVGRHFIASLVQGAVPNLNLSVLQALGTRHRALPNFALLLAAAALIDGATRAHIRAATAAAVCALLLFAWAPEFRIPPFPDRQWPHWAARLDEKLASGSRAPLVIPSHPPFFNIAFDAPPTTKQN